MSDIVVTVPMSFRHPCAPGKKGLGTGLVWRNCRRPPAWWRRKCEKLLAPKG